MKILTALSIAILFSSVFAITNAGAAQLIMLEEDGCPWCQKWNREVGIVYNKTMEARHAPLRRIDIHAHLPKDLKFLVKGKYTPAFVLINQGQEIGRIRGYPGEGFFWGLLQHLIKKLPNRSGTTN